MRKVLVLAFMLIGGVLFAQNIHWSGNYKDALKKAQKEHKPIMFIASKSDCRYCKKLKNETLSDAKVIQELNKKFVVMNVVADQEGSCMPYMLAVYTKGFPTIWFLDEHGEVLFQPIGGYIDKKTMLEALGTVTKTYKTMRVKEQKSNGKK